MERYIRAFEAMGNDPSFRWMINDFYHDSIQAGAYIGVIYLSLGIATKVFGL